MATLADTPSISAPRASLWARFVKAMDSMAHAVYVARGMEARARKMQILTRMTDEELAKLKLRREDIPHYVFRDVFYL